MRNFLLWLVAALFLTPAPILSAQDRWYLIHDQVEELGELKVPRPRGLTSYDLWAQSIVEANKRAEARKKATADAIAAETKHLRIGADLEKNFNDLSQEFEKNWAESSLPLVQEMFKSKTSAEAASENKIQSDNNPAPSSSNTKRSPELTTAFRLASEAESDPEETAPDEAEAGHNRVRISLSFGLPPADRQEKPDPAWNKVFQFPLSQILNVKIELSTQPEEESDSSAE